MEEFKEFLFELGNLHDCQVTLIEWKPHEGSMGFEIADLHFNFEGLPEYRGPLPGRIVLEGIREVVIDLSVANGALKIDDFIVEPEMAGTARALIAFWPKGNIRATFLRATFPKAL